MTTTLTPPTRADKPDAVRRSWLRRVSSPLLVFGDRVLLEPIRDGRLRNTGWPAGLASISGLALVVYAVTGAMLVLSPLLRQHVPMYVGPGGLPRPYLGLAMLFGGVTFAVALIQTAALHGHWALRTAGTLITVVVMTAMGIALPGGLMPPVAVFSGACLLALLIFALARIRKSFAWWEFAVVFGLVAGGCLVPALVVGRRGALIGVDIRPTISDFNMLLLISVTVPALLVAGAALTEIAVSSAHWGLTLVRQGRSPRVWGAVFAVIVMARLAQMAWSWRQDPELWIGSGFLMAALVVALCLGCAVGLARLAERRTGTTPPVPSPADMTEDWTPIRAAGAGIMFVVLITVLAIVVLQVLLAAFKIKIDGIGVVTDAIQGQGKLAVAQAVIAVVAAVFAVLSARRGRLSPALILISLTVALGSWTLLRVPVVRDYLPAWTAESLGGVAALAALGLGVVFAVRRTLDERRLFALVLVLALGITYDLRDILDEPLSWLLGFSGMAVAFFGLLWRVLTDGGITRGDTRNFPVASRVMFFWANALLAVIVLTQIALGRETGGATDMTSFVGAGDLMLGRPFYLAAVVACLWEALRPGRRSVDDADPGPGELVHDGAEVGRGDGGRQLEQDPGVETR